MQTAAPRLRIKGAAKAIAFYEKAFGAREIMRFEVFGSVAHAEIMIGNSTVFLGEESLEYGYPSPETLGGSPVGMHLWVENADAAVERAVAAGGKIVEPLTNHFYGHRTGQVLDPFGYRWAISHVVEDISVEEMHRRFEAMMQQGGPKPDAVNPVREGFRTLTPYIMAKDAPALVDFVKNVFDAEEKFRATGPTGGLHCEVLLGDSMMMIGGGGPGLTWRGESSPGAFHVYVPECDAVHKRAVQAGAEVVHEPMDQPYGERSSAVKDSAGNYWYIATRLEGSYKREGVSDVLPSLHPLRGGPVIEFLKRAFGAEELGRFASPEGVIRHAVLKIGSSQLELGEAHGPYQPMKSMFYLYVPDCDTLYHRAIAAGATSISEPKDQPYGDRSGGVRDAFGNQWYIATHIKDVTA